MALSNILQALMYGSSPTPTTSPLPASVVPDASAPANTAADVPDPLDAQIGNQRGVLAKQRSDLQDAIRSQFSAPPPTPASPKFGTKDLAWFLPALIGAFSGSKGAELGAGMISGALAGKQQDVTEQNQQNLGIYNNLIRQNQANVSAAQVGEQGAQSDLEDLLKQKQMGTTALLATQKLLSKQIEDARKALYNPAADVSGKQSALGTLQANGVATPADYEQAGVKNYKQLLGEGQTAKLAQQTQFLADAHDPKINEIWAKGDLYNQQMEKIKTMTPAELAYKAQQTKTSAASMQRQLVITALAPGQAAARITAAYANADRAMNMSEQGWAGLDLKKASDINSSLNAGLTDVRSQIRGAESEISKLEARKSDNLFNPDGKYNDIIDKQIATIKERLSGADGTGGLYGVHNDLLSKATTVRRALGLNPDGGGTLKLGQHPNLVAQRKAAANPQMQAALDAAAQRLQSKQYSQADYDEAVKRIMAVGGG